MGNDGGSIPKRRELVKESARAPTTSELKANALESQMHAWSVCPISGTPLDPTNTVGDARGRLYNYESVLQCLMPSSVIEETGTGSGDTTAEAQIAEFANTGIKGLRDVIKLKFQLERRKTDNSNVGTQGGGVSAASTGGMVIKPAEETVRVCPISMKELGPGTRSVYVVPCGHVFAGIAMKEISAAVVPMTANEGSHLHGDEKKPVRQECPECSEPFDAPRDIVTILPTDESDIEKLVQRAEELRALGLTHSLKKEKTGGKKKRKAEEKPKGVNGVSKNSSRVDRPGKAAEDISSRINNSMTASLTSRVLAEQEQNMKRRKIAASTAR